MKNMTIEEFVRKLIQYEGIAVEEFYVDENKYGEEVFVAKSRISRQRAVRVPDVRAKRRKARL
jgi:hypothetical protein